MKNDLGISPGLKTLGATPELKRVGGRNWQRGLLISSEFREFQHPASSACVTAVQAAASEHKGVINPHAPTPNKKPRGFSASGLIDFQREVLERGLEPPQVSLLDP
jgi:hypothetical protein